MKKLYETVSERKEAIEMLKHDLVREFYSELALFMVLL